MKTLITAIVLATGSVGAFAAEYTNFDIPPSTLTRAEVRAAISTPNANGILIVGDATQFTLPSAGAARANPATAMASVETYDRPNTRNASFQSRNAPGRV